MISTLHSFANVDRLCCSILCRVSFLSAALCVCSDFSFFIFDFSSFIFHIHIGNWYFQVVFYILLSYPKYHWHWIFPETQEIDRNLKVNCFVHVYVCCDTSANAINYKKNRTTKVAPSVQRISNQLINQSCTQWEKRCQINNRKNENEADSNPQFESLKLSTFTPGAYRLTSSMMTTATCR